MDVFLVTGGAGFIGSHLCAALLGRGDAVRVLDDLSSGSLANLPPGVEFVEGDIGNPATAARAIAGAAGCFHLAAIASVERGLQAWTETHRVNLSGTINLLDAIRRAAVPGERMPFVYASSAAVYGDNPALPLTETSATRPASAYGADKYGCELHAAVASNVHRIPTVGLRFFNVYGPRQDPSSPYSGVISIFCDRLARGLPIDLHGDGGQTRDFIYVEDVVSALLAAMGPPSTAAPAGPTIPLVFNVCSGLPVSVHALAQTIAGLCGRTPDIRLRPARGGDIRHSYGEPAAARAALRLVDPLPLRVGLERVLDWLGVAVRAD